MNMRRLRSQLQPAMNCAVCRKKIESREFLKCTSCDRVFDVKCTSNITSKFFRLMTAKSKDVWKCNLCTVNKKCDNKKSPQQKINHEQAVQSIATDDSISDVASFTARESTPTTKNTETMREKFQINVSTENSFQSLTDEEVLDDTLSKSTYQLNRSCPVVISNDSYDLKKLNEKMEHLQNKLGSAEEEIENLLSENFALQKKIAEQDKKIERLTRVCRSPCKGNGKRRNSLNPNVTIFSPTMPSATGFIEKLPKPPVRKTLTLQNEKENCNKARDVEQSYTNNKINNNTCKRRVLLLADETGRGLRNILQKRLGEAYQVTSVLKPYASLVHVLSNSHIQCQNFTKLDYVIILAGSHDKDLIKFQSSLYYYLNVLTDTNILFGQINKRLDGLTLDTFLGSLGPYFENMHYSQLSYFNKRKLDKNNTCRYLALDIFKVSHRHTMLNQQKTQSVNVSIANNHSDSFFRDY